MIRFKDLKAGLQSTPVQLNQTQQAFGSSWEGFVIHEIVYVNKSDKEIVYKAFGSLYTMTEENFDCRGYSKPERT